jgi:hypothetical protein
LFDVAIFSHYCGRVARPKAGNRRGSPEAVEKRRVARLFNDLLGKKSGGGKLDGRTEKRRQRLLHELETGKARGKRDLKPIDVLLRVQELIELGETLSSIRKVAKAKKPELLGEEIIGVLERLHSAYHFRPEVYRFVGIADDVLQRAGVLAPEPRPPRQKKRA